jgi:hypothetical protein
LFPFCRILLLLFVLVQGLFWTKLDFKLKDLISSIILSLEKQG